MDITGPFPVYQIEKAKDISPTDTILPLSYYHDSESRRVRNIVKRASRQFSESTNKKQYQPMFMATSEDVRATHDH